MKKKKKFIQQLGTITSPLCQHSAILEMDHGPKMRILFRISRVTTHKGALFALKSERKSMKKTHPCVEDDTEECPHTHPGDNLQNGVTLAQRRRYGA